jgi:predicted amidohydrolase
VIGDIRRNIERHKRLIDTAVTHQSDTIIFPELSLTGYEPKLAKALATHPGDGRFDDFQTISNAKQITIGVGVPTKHEAGICISMVIFRPYQPRQTYSKKHLHPDEEPFFVSGQSFLGSIGDKSNIALAICYELSVPEHAANANQSGAEIYIASVAKTANGVDKAATRLAEIARQYAMNVLMSNCVGSCDGAECAGKSSVWQDKGVLIGQLDDKEEGILVFDTDTKEVVVP